jgi:hypothetical protein
MRRSLIVFASFVATAAPPIAHANDSEAILAGGVLTFKKSEGITMESEELSRHGRIHRDCRW